MAGPKPGLSSDFETGEPGAGHGIVKVQSQVMTTSVYSPWDEEPSPEVATTPLHSFDEVYNEHVDFVWRSLRRLGVSESKADDLAQEVFLVVHRRLPEWEARASIKSWLFAIVLGIVRNHRRSIRRKDAVLEPLEAAELRAEERPSGHGPYASAAKAEARQTLYALLEHLDDAKREVFILAELEQMTTPEIARTLEVNPNTVYTRLRAARVEFDEALTRYRAREGGGR